VDTPRRQIGPFDGAMLVVGSMIGSGIFIVSAESARNVGTAGRLLLVWAVAGFLTLLAAASTAELGVLYPEAGGPYVFFREAYGELAGFLYGWSLVLVAQSGTIAAVAVAFAKFLGVLVPSLTPGGAKLVAIGVVALLTATNANGLKTGTRIQNVLTTIKIAALLALMLAGLALFASRPALGSPPLEAAPSGLLLALAFATASVGPLFSQSAWTNVTFAGAEVRDPARTFPRALLIGCALVGSLYVLTNVSYLKVLGLAGVAGAPEGRVGTAAAAAILPGLGAAVMAAAILVSTFGCNNGLILSGARVLYALAKDGLFFRFAFRLNRAGVPGLALLVQGVWASLLVLSGSYSQLLKYVVSAELALSVLLVLAVPVLRRKHPEMPRPYRTWGYPVTPALYAVLATALTVLLSAANPHQTWPGYALVLSGIPVYAIWKKTARARSREGL
jgi:APA family basic amino acid/polyamine antiporter